MNIPRRISSLLLLLGKKKISRHKRLLGLAHVPTYSGEIFPPTPYSPTPPFMSAASSASNSRMGTSIKHEAGWTGKRAVVVVVRVSKVCVCVVLVMLLSVCVLEKAEIETYTSYYTLPRAHTHTHRAASLPALSKHGQSATRLSPSV